MGRVAKYAVVGLCALGAAIGAACAATSDETQSDLTGDDCTDEVCGDGLDNDCDGDADEGCPCNEGDEQECYTGPPASANQGVCRPGTQTCGAGDTWGDCLGQVVPSGELCDKLDNDCDGTTDEDCSVELLENGELCWGDDQCLSGNCECEDFDCQARYCTAEDCVCGYGTSGSCDDPMTGQQDPEDCDGEGESCGEIDECLGP